MGKSKNRKPRSLNYFYSASDDESMSSTSTGWSELAVTPVTESVDSHDSKLDRLVDALYEKRGSTREKALSGLVEAFERHVLVGYVENKTITLAHQFSNSIKRGSSKEACLASRAMGLLAITAGCGSKTHEILEESTPYLSESLKSGYDSLKKSSVLDCLAVVSFIGGDNVEETEKTMKIIWDTMHPKSCSNVTPRKPAPAVLAAAISAWTFLFTTVNEWRVSSTNWQGFIPFLSSLLDKDDRSVRIAAGEALALIFETDRLDKFSGESNSNLDGSDSNGDKQHGGGAYIDALKGKILSQARNLSMDGGGKGCSKADLQRQRDMFKRVLAFIETGEFDEISVNVLNKSYPLKVTTWTQSIQLNFLRRFLGSGYLKHMQDNELLHDVFDFVPKNGENLPVKGKRMSMSQYTLTSKERTQYLNKCRMRAQGKNEGLFAVGVEDD